MRSPLLGQAAQQASVPDPRLGTYVGKYRLTARLGSGGMGVVYAAIDPQLRRCVAIKLLHDAHATQADVAQRFLREARAAARLNHPNVVSVYGVDRVGSSWYLVMEWVRGLNAQDYLTRRGAFPWYEATAVIADACRGLVAVHRTGLIHRDIKPSNLMRSDSGVVKLVDFGLAKLGDQHGPTLSIAGQLLATPRYMSPEQCRCDPVDERSDLYSLGATYFALLTGRPPYTAEMPVQVMFAHCSQPVPDPHQHNAEIPEACAAIVRRAMAKLPHERFGSAADMLQALEGVLSGAPAELANQPSTWDQLLRSSDIGPDDGTLSLEAARLQPPARRWRWAVAVALILAVMAGATWVEWSRRQDKHTRVAVAPAAVATEKVEGAIPAATAAEAIERSPTTVPVAASEGPASAEPVVARDRPALLAAANSALVRDDLAAARRALTALAHLDAASEPLDEANLNLVARLQQIVAFRENLIADGHVLVLDMIPASLAIAPQGDRVAVGGGAGDVGVLMYNLATGDLIFDFHLRHYRTREQAAVRGLAFSPDGHDLLAGAVSDAGSKLLRWTRSDTRPNALAHLAEGDSLIYFAASADGRAWGAIVRPNAPDRTVPTIRIWDSTAATPRLVIDNEVGEASSLIFVPGSVARWASAAVDGTVRLWNSETGELLAKFDTAVTRPGLAVAPDGGTLAVAGRRYVQLWRLDPEPSRELIQVPGGEAICAAFSADGAWLATGGGTEIGGVVTVWDVAARKPLHTFRNHGAAVRAVAFSADGELLAAGGDDKTVRLWNLRRLRAEQEPDR